MKKYDVRYFIKKFSAIPDAQWTTRNYREGDKCCALGHCKGPNSQESMALYSLVLNNLGVLVSHINDGGMKRDDLAVRYRDLSITLFRDEMDMGDTPKERVLTALEMIKAGVTV